MTSTTIDQGALKAAISSAIFDPGAEVDMKDDRTLTEWQTDAVMNVLARLSASRETVKVTHRHKKRGSEYVLIGFGTFVGHDPVRDMDDLRVKEVAPGVWQARFDFVGAESEWARAQCAENIRNGAIVAIYRSVDDGSLWVRPREEFEDGRFEEIPVRILSSIAISRDEAVAWPGAREQRLLTAIANALFANREANAMQHEHADELRNEIKPHLEALGLHDEGDGWGFSDESLAAFYASPVDSRDAGTPYVSTVEAEYAAGVNIAIGTEIEISEARDTALEEAAKAVEALKSGYLPGGPLDMKGAFREAAAAIRQLKVPANEQHIERRTSDGQ